MPSRRGRRRSTGKIRDGERREKGKQGGIVGERKRKIFHVKDFTMATAKKKKRARKRKKKVLTLVTEKKSIG